MKDRDLLLNNLSLLKDSNDPISLFKAMEIIINLCDEEKLDEFILNRKEILLNYDPVKFIGYHVSFYSSQEKYIKALEILQMYQEAPFINLTTEDFMRELHDELLNLIYPKKKQLNYSYEDLKNELFSNNEDKFLHAVKFLSEANIRKYLPLIEEVLISIIQYRLKILLQFILIEQSVDKKICVKKDDGDVFYFIPNKTSLPFQTAEYKVALNYIESLNESPSVIDNAIQLMNMVEVRVFPFSFLKKFSSPLYSAEILIYLTKKLLLENPSLEDLIKNTGLDKEDIETALDELNKII